jgi:hypothetical protein
MLSELLLDLVRGSALLTTFILSSGEPSTEVEKK